MRKCALLSLLAILAGLQTTAQVRLPTSLRLAGPLDDSRSSLGDDIFHFPYGKGSGTTPIHGWISIDFSAPVDGVAKFRLRWGSVGDDPVIPFDSGHFFLAKFVVNFDSVLELSEGKLDLATGEISDLKMHAVFQNLLFHKTARNNRFPFSSLGKSFTTLFVDYPGLEFPFDLPYSERPPIRREARFLFDSSRRITGFEFGGLTFVPIGIVPRVALMPTYSFGRRGVTIVPGASGCLPGTLSPDQCLTDERSPDGNPVGESVYLNPSLNMLTQELQEIDGPQKVPPARPDGPSAGTAAATLADRMYVFGGFDGQQVSGRAAAYDPSRNEWSPLPDLPRGTWQACAAAAAGRLLVVGGKESIDGPPVAAVHAFDPGARAWSAAAPLPAPLSNAACAALDNRVYVFGGWTGGAAATVVSEGAWVYDPASNQWAATSRLPVPLAGSAAAVVGRDIYVVNGTQDGNAATNRVFVFSPVSGTWREAPRTNRGLYGATAGYVSGRLFLSGGRVSAKGSLDLGGIHHMSQFMQFLVPGRGEWFTGLDPKLPVSEPAGAVIGQTWYVAGGDTSLTAGTPAPTDAVQAFTAFQGWVISDTRPVYSKESVRNGASFSVGPAELSPGTRAAILGIHLAGETRKAPPVRFDGRYFTTDLPEELAGVRVTVGGEPAGILAVSPERVDFQVPFGMNAQARLVRVQMSRAGVEGPAVLVPIVESAPALFIYNHGEARAINHLDEAAAIARNQDGRLNYASQPTRPGETVTLLATGLGDVAPRPERLQRGPRESAVPLRNLEVLIDERPAPLESARLVPAEAGVYELRVKVPVDARRGVRVAVRLRAGEISSNRAVIVIE